MSDLVTFLNAQLDADEAAAREATPGPWDQTNGQSERTEGRVVAWGLTAVAAATRPEDVTHIARHDPARVLAEVVAKRAIVEAVASGFYDSDLEVVLRALASAYEGAPGWQEEWR